MNDLVRNALNRNLASAESRGNAALAARIRARLGTYGGSAEAVVSPPKVRMPKRKEEPTESAISFASPQAGELATDLGVGRDAFDFAPSGKNGFTVADVKRAAGINEETTDGDDDTDTRLHGAGADQRESGDDGSGEGLSGP
jgi:hypothetical protein